MGIGAALQIIFCNGHWAEEILIFIKSYRTGRICFSGR
jgi:hypothetical protein